MPSRIELKKLSLIRLKEVKTLYENNLYDGASYLAGYVIELALKARICKVLGTDYLERGNVSRSYLTHNLIDLITLSGLSKKFTDEISDNRDFKINWALIQSWNEAFRYLPVGTRNKNEIEDLINAIEDPENGIFTWIKKRW